MKKQQYILPVMLILSVMMLSLVAAANTATLNKPAASEVILGTYTLNATVDTNSLAMTNAKFYYKTAAGAWTLISNVTNATADQTEWTTTFATTGLIDQVGMTFNVTLHNATAQVTADTSATVVIDNGDPTAGFSTGTTADAFSILTSQTFTVGSAADTTIGISNCTVTMNSISSSITGITSNACDNTAYAPSAFGITTDGDYTYTLTVTDANSDTDTTSSRTLNVKVAPGGGGGSVQDDDDANVDDEDTDDSGSTGKGIFVKIADGISGFFQAIVDFFINIFKK